jgi:U4/U6.U5 tri-snRNP-associated protein 2
MNMPTFKILDLLTNKGPKKWIVLQKMFCDKMSDLDSESEELLVPLKKQRINKTETIQGLYLESINRALLDFDFEKVCSISLSNINVYACLVCGKYFQGRGIHSHAYYHAINEDHHVFINLDSLKIFVLPDGYEVQNSSLNDIKVFVFEIVYHQSHFYTRTSVND